MTWVAVAAAAVIGAIVGSFLATICVRWPEGRQASAGRSSCDHCRRTLGPWELVPVLSAAVAGGRCRTCGGRIARIHLAVELAAATLSGIALLLQPNAEGAALAALWLLLLAPAVLDARHLWLPDQLTAVLAIGGLTTGGIATGASLMDRVAGGVVGFASLAALALAYAKLRGRQGMGAGDPKLFGAIGLWTGWMALPGILVIASVAGLGWALGKRRGAAEQFPFGTLLAIGAILWTAIAAWRGTPLL